MPLPDGMPYDGGLYKQMPNLVRDIKLNVSVVRARPTNSTQTMRNQCRAPLQQLSLCTHASVDPYVL